MSRSRGAFRGHAAVASEAVEAASESRARRRRRWRQDGEERAREVKPTPPPPPPAAAITVAEALDAAARRSLTAAAGPAEATRASTEGRSVEAMVAADAADAADDAEEADATETIVLESALLAAAADSCVDADELAKALSSSIICGDRGNQLANDLSDSRIAGLESREKKFCVFFKKSQPTAFRNLLSLSHTHFFFFSFPTAINSPLNFFFSKTLPSKKKKKMSGLARVVSSEASDEGYEPKTILITGAAGFIGSHTALRLVKNLPNVRVS